MRNNWLVYAIELLDRLGVIHKMPALMARGQTQLSTEDANETRLVTKIRWVVEARNGHIKSIFKFLDHVISITHVRNLGSFYRIAAAIINRYHPMLTMRGADENLAQSMLARVKDINVVQARVDQDPSLRGWSMHRWARFTAEHVTDFPVLTLDFLKELTVGVYQINLAPSYVHDKLTRDDGDELQIELLQDNDRVPEPGFLRIRVYSRFRNATKRQLWIAYRPTTEEDDNEAPNPILGYYCTCPSSARTIGTCVHVASVVWYLGYARHQPNVHYPSSELIELILDAGHRPAQEML